MVPTLFADSPAMRPVVGLIARATAVRAGVLIRGESGTGRRVVAEIIHAMDARSGPFVSVDCAVAGVTSLETALFGTLNGGHPDLETVTPDSRLAAAAGGTIHLSNIADAPARVQQRLARVLRDREAKQPDGIVVPLEVRPMTSVDPDIDTAVADGQVRLDLFQRLSAIDIDVPPLRRRREDIPALTRHFIDQICAACGAGPKAMTRSAMALVAALPWHGNATELRQTLAAVLARHSGTSPISVEDLLLHVRLDGGPPLSPGAGTLREARNRFERDYIATVLSYHQGRVSDAARALGIQRTNLYRKLRSLRVKKDTLQRH